MTGGALVVGAGGQDGTLLSSQLEAQGLPVVRLGRPGARAPLAGVDLLDARAVQAVVDEARPAFVYYLAAHHGAASQREQAPVSRELEACWQVHVQGLVHVLEAVAAAGGGARVFYAASSHVFGEPAREPQDEQTPFAPRSPYAITKAAGIEVARAFRRKGLRVSTGILYNHESALRAPGYLSARVTAAAVAARDAVARGQPFRLELASLGARVDWGWAPDFTRAMQAIVQAPQPGDWVVATGELHSVADFCRVAFAAVGLDWTRHVVETGAPLAPHACLRGDSARLRAATGWRPSVGFEEMVHRLVEAASLARPQG